MFTGIMPIIILLRFLCISHLALFLPTTAFADSTAFLLHTLRTHVLFACENEDLSIKCPEGTTISIDSANYGRQLSNLDMCPYRWTAGVANDTSVIIPKSEDTNCRAAESLQILISNCQNEEKCTLRVTNEVFGEDPCPGTHKYLDVTYKCRPNDFKSLVVCEHRHMQLYCEGANIIAIYSASFGRTELGSMECPSYTMHEIDCQSPSTLEEVMKRCHGRRNCAVKVASKIFGDPCPKGTHKYLNVVYSCVSRKVFRKPRRYIGLPRVHPGKPINTEDKPTEIIEVISPDLKGPGVVPVEEHSYNNMESAVTDLITEVYPTEHPDPMQGWVISSMAFANFVTENKEPVLLALLLGAAVGLVMLLLAVIIHCQIKVWKLRRKLDTVTKRHNLSSGGDLLLAVQEENRIDVNELWRRPPSPLILANRTFDNQNGNRSRNNETEFRAVDTVPTPARTQSVSDSHSTIHRVEIDSNRNTIQRAQRAPSDSTTVSWNTRTFPSHRSQELDSNRDTLPRYSREPSEVTTYHNDGTLPLPGSRPLNNYYP